MDLNMKRREATVYRKSEESLKAAAQ